MSNDIVIHTPTQDDFIEVSLYFIDKYEMLQYDEFSEDDLKNIWNDYESDTCINTTIDKDGLIKYTSCDFYKSWGDTVLNMNDFYRDYYNNSKEILKDFK